MAEQKVVGSYLYELKPYVNTAAWKKASGDISKVVQSSNVSYSDWNSKRKEYKSTLKDIREMERRIDMVNSKIKKASGEELEMWKKLLGTRGQIVDDGKGNRVWQEGTGMYGELDRLNTKANTQLTDATLMEAQLGGKGKLAGVISNFASGITKAAGSVMAFVGVVQKVIDTTKEIVNEAKEFSNKFNTTGAFSDMDIRDMQARYGVSATRANAMNAALGQMGLSTSDIGRMNDAQRKAYDELISYYESGIDRIDTQKFDEFNQEMERFQLAYAKFQIDLKTSAMKLFAESESFKKLTGSLTNFFEKVVEFLDSPIVQWFFDTFIEFLNAILEVGSSLLDLVTFGGSSSSGTVNNTNNQSSNNFYIYGSDSDNSESLARNIALKMQSGGVG